MWSSTARRIQPALPYVRRFALFWLGLSLAGLGINKRLRAPDRSATGSPSLDDDHEPRLAQLGEETVQALQRKPSVKRVIAALNRASATLATRTQQATDETHDTLEELYARVEQLPGTLVGAGARRLKKAPMASRNE